jgi:protein SCO1/2
MNRRAMSKSLLASLGAISLLLSACSSRPAPEQPPLAGATIGGPFTLTSSDGRTVRWEDFEGRYRIVYFGYTYCPDICPTDVQRMMQGFARFKQEKPELAAQVQPIFISIDPERDTPAKVGEFTRAFSADLLGLTGTPQQVAGAAKAFAAYYAKAKGGSGTSYLMDHSRGTYLMGRKGEPIALLPVDTGPEAVAAELAKWVR